MIEYEAVLTRPEHLAAVAVAEKLSALRTEDYFREHGQRGNIRKAKNILKRAGRGEPAMPGDGLA